MRRDQPEYRLTCMVADLLRICAKPGVFWTHIPMGEARTVMAGARLKRAGTRKGNPDFLLIVGGRPVGLELKLEKKSYQSADQRDVERDWTVAGGLYYCAKGYAAVVDFLTMIEAIRPIIDNTRFAPRQPAEAA